LGRQDFTSISGNDSLRLSDPRSVQRVNAKKRKNGTIPKYHSGINEDVLSKTSLQRFGSNLLVSCGDATRGRQMLVRSGNQLVGQRFHPDCKKWSECVWFVPEYMDQLVEIIQIVVQLQMLSSEFFTEQLRCISSPRISSLTYVCYPEPSKGSSGFMTYKYWFQIIYLTPQGLSLVAFITDGCAYGIGAGKLFGTPSVQLLALGCTYLGLPLDDYKYCDVYCRPSYIDSDCVFQIPKPIGYLPDISHWVRLVRRNLDNLAYLVFWCVNENDIEGAKVASFGFLRKLAQQRANKGMKLSDIVNVNKYADMKNDAAYSMVAADTITLLREHFPDDKATLLVLEAVHYLVKVMREKTFTNPILAVEYAWRCAHIFELQTRYVKKVAKIKQPGDHTPSYQFLDGLELMACKITNHFLMFHRHCLGRDNFDWSHSSLAAANSDDLEGTHSQGRHQKNGHMDVNFTFNEWLIFLSNNECINEAARLLETGGVLLGKPRHTQSTHRGTLNLGDLEDVDITHNGYVAPEDYDDFVEDLIQARERGIAWARDRWEFAFGVLAIQQFEDKNMWTERELVPKVDQHLTTRRFRTQEEFAKLTPEESMNVARDLRVRDQVKFPVDMRMASGRVEFTHLPDKRIDPDLLEVPLKVMEHMQQMDLKVREEIMKDQVRAAQLGGIVKASEKECAEDASCSDDDVQHQNPPSPHQAPVQDEVTLYGRLEHLLEASEIFASTFDLLPVSKPTMLDAQGVAPRGNVKAGLVTKDKCTGEYVYVDRVLHRYQRSDVIIRDRRYRQICQRVRGFAPALRDGHDIVVGACLLVAWGTADRVAVVRVMKMYAGETSSGNDQVHSLKLDRKNLKQSFRLELLKPTSRTSLGSQVYTSSGYWIGPVGAKSVKRVLNLQSMSNFVAADRVSQMHDALLGTEDIAQFGKYRLVTVWEDILHKVKIGVSGAVLTPEKIPGYNRHRTCYRCRTSFEGGDQGLLISCTQCRRSVHQLCTQPTVMCEDMDSWVCSPCRGEGDVCIVCNVGDEPMQFNATESCDSNNLMHCHECGIFVHQSCHEPALYPTPIGLFLCSECVDYHEPVVNYDFTEPQPKCKSKRRTKVSKRTVQEPTRATRPRLSAPPVGALRYTSETSHHQPSWRQLHGADARTTRNERLTHHTSLRKLPKKNAGSKSKATPSLKQKPSFTHEDAWYRCVRCGEKKDPDDVIVNPSTKDAMCSSLCVGKVISNRRNSLIPHVTKVKKTVTPLLTSAAVARSKRTPKNSQQESTRIVDWHMCVCCCRRMSTKSVHIDSTTKDARCVDEYACANVHSGGRRGTQLPRVTPERHNSEASPMNDLPHGCESDEPCAPAVTFWVTGKVKISYDKMLTMQSSLQSLASHKKLSRDQLVDGYLSLDPMEAKQTIRAVIKHMLIKQHLSLLPDQLMTSTLYPYIIPAVEVTKHFDAPTASPSRSQAIHRPLETPTYSCDPAPMAVSLSSSQPEYPIAVSDSDMECFVLSSSESPSPRHQAVKHQVVSDIDDAQVRNKFAAFIEGVPCSVVTKLEANTLRKQWALKLYATGMSTIQITSASMQRLAPKCCLGDVVVNAFIRAIMPRLYDQHRRVVIVDSLSTQKVLTEGVDASIGFYNVHTAENPMRCDTTKFAYHLDRERTHKIVFIVNNIHHWYIVCFDMRANTYMIMNSIASGAEFTSSGNHIPALIADWVSNQLQVAVSTHRCLLVKDSNCERPPLLTNWELPTFLATAVTQVDFTLVQHPNIPQQSDSTSCGLFCIAYVYYILIENLASIKDTTPVFQTLMSSQDGADSLGPYLVLTADEFTKVTMVVLEHTEILCKSDQAAQEGARHAAVKQGHENKNECWSDIGSCDPNVNELLVVRLDEFGLEAVGTTTNGDCMLDALAQTFNLGPIDLNDLRKQLIDVLQSRSEFVVDDENSPGIHSRLRDLATFGSSHEQDASWECYIKRMSLPGEWCDDKMLLAASILFCSPITIIGTGIVDVPSLISPPSHWKQNMNSDAVVVLGHIQEHHYFATRTQDKETPISPKNTSIPDYEYGTDDESDVSSGNASDNYVDVSIMQVVLLYGGRNAASQENAYVEQMLHPALTKKLGCDIVLLNCAVADVPSEFINSRCIYILWRDFMIERSSTRVALDLKSIRGRSNNAVPFEDLLGLNGQFVLPSITSCTWFASNEPYMRALAAADVSICPTVFLTADNVACGSIYKISCLHGTFTNEHVAKGLLHKECSKWASDGLRLVIKRTFSSQAFDVMVADTESETLKAVDAQLATRATIMIQPWLPLNEVSCFIVGQKVHFAVLSLHNCLEERCKSRIFFLHDIDNNAVMTMALSAVSALESSVYLKMFRVDVSVCGTHIHNGHVTHPGHAQFVHCIRQVGFDVFYNPQQPEMYQSFTDSVVHEIVTAVHFQHKRK
jgi:hypothetical protein